MICFKHMPKKISLGENIEKLNIVSSHSTESTKLNGHKKKVYLTILNTGMEDFKKIYMF